MGSGIPGHSYGTPSYHPYPCLRANSNYFLKPEPDIGVSIANTRLQNCGMRQQIVRATADEHEDNRDNGHCSLVTRRFHVLTGISLLSLIIFLTTDCWSAENYCYSIENFADSFPKPAEDMKKAQNFKFLQVPHVTKRRLHSLPLAFCTRHEAWVASGPAGTGN